jgi:hypothetical protein
MWEYVKKPVFILNVGPCRSSVSNIGSSEGKEPELEKPSLNSARFQRLELSMSRELEVINFSQGGVILAIARLDGKIVQCAKEGTEAIFGCSHRQLMLTNAFDLFNVGCDNSELRKLCSPAVCNPSERSCLLRTKQNLFLWADRVSHPVSGKDTLRRDAIRLPESAFAVGTAHAHAKRNSSEKKGYALLETSDFSFNDVYEDTSIDTESQPDSSMASPVVSAGSLADGASTRIPSAKENEGEEESGWGWFMAISPSSSTTFSNITSQIRLL